MTESEREYEDAHEVHIGWWASRCLRAEPWPLLLVSLLLLLTYCWWYSSPIVAMVGLNYYGDFCYGSMLFSVITAGRGVQLLVARWCADRHGLSFREVRSRHRFLPWFATIMAMTFVVVREEVPLYAGFSISRSSFDDLADQAIADPTNAHRLAGQWAGGYRVAGVEVIGETVVFYLDRPEGNYGFARVPAAKCDHIFNMPAPGGGNDSPNHHPAFPPFSRQNSIEPVGDRIAGEWFVVYSSYWRTKVGPS